MKLVGFMPTPKIETDCIGETDCIEVCFLAKMAAVRVWLSMFAL